MTIPAKLSFSEMEAIMDRYNGINDTRLRAMILKRCELLADKDTMIVPVMYKLPPFRTDEAFNEWQEEKIAEIEEDIRDRKLALEIRTMWRKMKKAERLEYWITYNITQKEKRAAREDKNSIEFYMKFTESYSEAQRMMQGDMTPEQHRKIEAAAERERLRHNKYEIEYRDRLALPATSPHKLYGDNIHTILPMEVFVQSRLAGHDYSLLHGTYTKFNRHKDILGQWRLDITPLIDDEDTGQTYPAPGHNITVMT